MTLHRSGDNGGLLEFANCRIILLRFKISNTHFSSTLGGTLAPAAAKSLQSCLTLCDPRDGSPPGSPVPGILQARTVEWVAISFSNAWKWKVKVKALSRVPTLCDPMDYSLPGSSIHGIFQARVLEWVAIAFSIWCPDKTFKKTKRVLGRNCNNS